MATYNKGQIIGNVTTDVKMGDGTNKYCYVNVASNESYKNDKGEKIDKANFISFKAYGKTADICAQYLHKGSPVFIEYKLSSWDKEVEGKKRTIVDHVIINVQFLEKKPSGTGESSSKKPYDKPEDMPGEVNPDETPF